ncbi:MAG: class I SAM-dependent methyltransferase [Gammaproteobacteria bacterium]|nr:class I SAM-dependent methyltransferase [Gammaproteobacteria bacterium]
MDNSEIHEKIQEKFHIWERDNLPYSSGRRFTRRHLAELFGELNFDVGAEVGVRRGNFSRKLCDANRNLKLSCVDPWMAYSNKYNKKRQDRIYQEAVTKLQDYPVEIIRETSMDGLQHFRDGTLDFVFIDGNHTYDYVAPDIILWSRKVRSGGIVAVHDYYCFGHSGVVPAVNGYVQGNNIQPWYVTKELEPTAYWVKP